MNEVLELRNKIHQIVDTASLQQLHNIYQATQEEFKYLDDDIIKSADKTLELISTGQMKTISAEESIVQLQQKLVNFKTNGN